jgi:hypothetical protein
MLTCFATSILLGIISQFLLFTPAPVKAVDHTEIKSNKLQNSIITMAMQSSEFRLIIPVIYFQAVRFAMILRNAVSEFWFITSTSNCI